jgi:hypothetical protein
MAKKGAKLKRALAQISEDPPDARDEILLETLGASGETSKRIKIAGPGDEPRVVVLQPAPAETTAAPISTAGVKEKMTRVRVDRSKTEMILTFRQNAAIIAEYTRWRETPIGGSTLDDMLLSHEADTMMGEPCLCGNGALCEAMCHECVQYRASCLSCFVKNHKHNYFHWLERWNPENGFYTRHDMSTVGPPLHLGHHGDPCSGVAETEKPCTVIITHTNGIHITQLHWCAHTKERVTALMGARLFPATFEYPESAYTFEVMKAFQVHHLESKTSAYDYCGSLMRLTDNAFAESNVAVREYMQGVLDCLTTCHIFRTYSRILCALLLCGVTYQQRSGWDRCMESMIVFLIGRRVIWFSTVRLVRNPVSTWTQTCLVFCRLN